MTKLEKAPEIRPDSSLEKAPELRTEKQPFRSTLKDIQDSLKAWEALSQREGVLSPDEEQLKEIQTLIQKINAQLKAF